MQPLHQQKETMVYVAIKELNPAVYNPRKWSKKATDDLTASIKGFGLIDPIIVNKARGNTVVGGHFRLHVAKKLGYTEVPCVFVSIEDERQEKELNLRLNKNSGDWDWSLLKDWETSLLQEAGFDDSELKEMMDQVLEPVKEDDFDPTATLEAKETKVKLGDVWQLGKHRLMCGDSTKLEDVEKLMDGKKADMVFTDPPYNTGMSEKTNSGSTWLNHMFDDSYTDDEWAAFLTDFLASYFLLMKDDCVAYISLDWRRSHELVAKAKDVFHFSNLIVWDKVVHGLGSDYQYTHEFLHVFKKGKPIINSHQGDREYQDIWHIQRKVGRDDDHATKKPLELITRSLSHASRVNDIVVDLFAGSGSTLIACEQTKRICYTMELDPKYCDVVIARWEKLTGQTAIKL
jgi:DNA modification methylase